MFLLIVPFLLTQSNRGLIPDFTKLNFTTLGGVPPIASFTHSPEIATPGEAITFDASGSYDPDGSIVKYSWNFGEGNITVVTSPLIIHSYPVDGNYTVELTVTDNSGSTSVAAAVVQVSCEVFFRVVILGTLIPLSNVNVTVYYKTGSTWMKAPTGRYGLEIKYDLVTQPYLADTYSEKYRNPGITATILRHSASNIGFDMHPTTTWTVFFKFQWGPYVTYWPNQTTRVYTYYNGAVEAHDYLPYHRAYWDASASTYVIKATDIAGACVNPTECHPIIVGMLAPPPPQRYYLTVKTDPSGITTIPDEGWYCKDTDVSLTAPQHINVTTTHRYKFSYWDVDGTSQGNGVNPITAHMAANHTATAHYITQYFLSVSSAHDSPTPTSGWLDFGASVIASVTSPVADASGAQYLCTGWSGTGSVPASGSTKTVTFTINQPSAITWNWKTQYQVTFGAGVGSDFTGIVLMVDGVNYGVNALPVSLWWDSGSSHTFAFQSPLVVTANAKQYVWTSTTGLSTSQSGSITATTSGSVTASYKTQYYLAVSSPYDSPNPTSGWFDAGASITASVTSPMPGSAGARYVCTGWSGAGSVPASGSVSSVAFTINQPSSVTWNWKTQYQVTLDQTGVGSDFTGTVVTVDSVNFSVNMLPSSSWWDSGSSHSFSFASPLTVNGKQYSWSSTSGLSSLEGGTLIIAGSGNIVGNYIVQSQITFDQIGVNSDFTGTIVIVDGVSYYYNNLPKLFLWNVGSTHSFAFESPLTAGVNSKRYVWTSTTGLSNVQSGSITVTTYGSIVGNYKTQYYLTLTTNSLIPNGAGWYDSGTFASISTVQYENIVPGSSRYKFNGWTTGDMSEITDPQSPSTTVFIDAPKTVTANYVIQYAVTFDQSGVGSDFTGTVATVDGTGYTVSTLPTPVFWWDSGSSHTFAFSSPLTVDTSKSYDWVSTTGLSTLQGGSLTITGSGSATGNYVVHTKCEVTFGISGLDTDVVGPIVTIDSIDYGLTNLPVSFWWDTGSSHTYSFTTIIGAGPSKRYVLDNVTGLSTSPSDTIVISGPGSIVGHYKTQYYLTLTTNPPGVNSPSGSGWYDSGMLATVSTTAFVDIIPGSSRYRFNGWSTTDMAEISNPTMSPTTVLMDKAKTVTANYATQCFVTFYQSGVGSDFTGIVATVDGVNYMRSGLPVSFWWDQGSSHTFTYHSPLVGTPDAKQYAWSSSSGLSTQQSESITLTTYGSITGNYKTQYKLAVTSPFGSPTPVSGWFDADASVTVSVTSPASGPAGTRYICLGWTGTGSVPPSGTSPTVTFTMNSPSSITWTWKTQYYLTVGTIPSGIATILGAGWYDLSATLSLSAPQASGYNFLNWDVDGTSQGAGVTSISVTMNSRHTAVAHYSIKSPGIPIGGRTISFVRSTSTSLVSAYVMTMALFSAVLALVRRKRKR